MLLTDRLNDLCAVADQPAERIDIEIVPFVPRWSQIDPDRKLKLHRSGTSGLLGHGAILGSRARDWQSQFRVRIGPLTGASSTCSSRPLRPGDADPSLPHFKRSLF